MAGVLLGSYLGTYLGSRVVGTPGSGSFSPLDLSPVAWWDGTDASTMNTAIDGSGSAPTSGNSVGRWTDKVNAKVLAAGADTQRPVWNSSGYLTFDGSDKLSLAAVDTAFDRFHEGGQGSVFLRFRMAAGSDGQRVVIADTHDAGTQRGFSVWREDNLTWTNESRFRVGDGSSNILDTEHDSDITSASGFVDLVIAVDGSSDVQVWVDAVRETFSAPTWGTGTAAGPLTLGGRSSTGNLFFVGDLEQAVFTDTVASQSDVDSFLAWPAL